MFGFGIRKDILAAEIRDCRREIANLKQRVHYLESEREIYIPDVYDGIGEYGGRVAVHHLLHIIAQKLGLRYKPAEPGKVVSDDDC